MWHLIGDGLVVFEPIGGTNPVLVPDLAAATPEPADGGRTYTFELRRDIRYSSGEVVARATSVAPSNGAFSLNIFRGLLRRYRR